jgi:ABC-type multidrug transport system fused ATPase/permease subunit
LKLAKKRISCEDPKAMTKMADKSDGQAVPQAGIPAMLRLVWQIVGVGIRAQKQRLTLSLLFRIAASISLLGPYYIWEIIDRALPAKDLSLFWKYCLLLVLVHALSYIFWAIQVYLSYAASETVFLELRSRLVQTLLNKPKAFFTRHPAGDLVARLVHDVDYAAGFFYQNLLRSLLVLTAIGLSRLSSSAW